MTAYWRRLLALLGVVGMVGTPACGKSKREPSAQADGGGGTAPAGAAGAGGNSNQAGQAGGGAGNGGETHAGRGGNSGDSTGGDGIGASGIGASSGNATGDSGAGGSPVGGGAGTGGAEEECRTGESRYTTGCTYAPLPAEGCYASCAEAPCTQGECLVLSVPTPISGGIIPPDAQCGERHALCVDVPLCVAAGQIDWDYLAAASNSPVLRSSIDAVDGPEGKLRLYDLTGGAPVGVCAVDLPPCAGDGIDLDDVNRALANPDLQDLLQAGGLYGDRGDNGSVLRIVAEDASVEVGQACGDQSGCRPVEAPLAALAAMLRGLTDAALADARCSGAPPLP